MAEVNDDQEIKRLALANGFKLKEQPDGRLDLNPYVYEFARALADLAQEAEREECAKLCKELEQRLLARKPALKAWKIAAATAAQLWLVIKERGEA